MAQPQDIKDYDLIDFSESGDAARANESIASLTPVPSVAPADGNVGDLTPTQSATTRETSPDDLIDLSGDYDPPTEFKGGDYGVGDAVVGTEHPAERPKVMPAGPMQVGILIDIAPEETKKKTKGGRNGAPTLKLNTTGINGNGGPFNGLAWSPSHEELRTIFTSTSTDVAAESKAVVNHVHGGDNLVSPKTPVSPEHSGLGTPFDGHVNTPKSPGTTPLRPTAIVFIPRALNLDMAPGYQDATPQNMRSVSAGSSSSAATRLDNLRRTGQISEELAISNVDTTLGQAVTPPPGFHEFNTATVSTADHRTEEMVRLNLSSYKKMLKEIDDGKKKDISSESIIKALQRNVRNLNAMLERSNRGENWRSMALTAEDAQREVKRLTAKCEELKKAKEKYVTLKEKNDELTQQNQELEEQVSQLSGPSMQLAANDQSARIAELEHSLEIVAAEKTDMEKTLGDCMKELHAAQEQVAMKDAENEMLTQQLRKLSTLAKSKGVSDLEAKLRIKSTECDRSRTELEHTVRRMQALQEKMTLLNNNKIWKNSASLIQANGDKTLPATVLPCIECLMWDRECDNKATCKSCQDANTQCARFRCSSFRRGVTCAGFPYCYLRHGDDGWVKAAVEKKKVSW